MQMNDITNYLFPIFIGYNKPFSAYFIESLPFRILYSGGYYSLWVILALSIIAYFFKNFRHMLLSIIFAITAIFFVIFAYEAFENFQFIPSI